MSHGGKSGVPDSQLTKAIKNYAFMIKNRMRHPNHRRLRKVVRGLRRRRNWLMRNGQWPVVTK